MANIRIVLMTQIPWFQGKAGYLSVGLEILGQWADQQSRFAYSSKSESCCRVWSPSDGVCHMLERRCNRLCGDSYAISFKINNFIRNHIFSYVFRYRRSFWLSAVGWSHFPLAICININRIFSITAVECYHHNSSPRWSSDKSYLHKHSWCEYCCDSYQTKTTGTVNNVLYRRVDSSKLSPVLAGCRGV